MPPGIKEKAISVFTSITTGSVASAFFGIFQGRCTFAAIGFSIVGVWGWIHGRDLTPFTVFVTAIQSLLVVHSWKDDVAERNQVKAGNVQ